VALDLTTCVVRSAEPLTAMAGHEVLMFSAEQSRYYGLNRVASAIWDRLETPTTVGELCADLGREFEVSPDRCRDEVVAFVSVLLTKGLARIADGV
jgi:hypothetical protein